MEVKRLLKENTDVNVLGEVCVVLTRHDVFICYEVSHSFYTRNYSAVHIPLTHVGWQNPCVYSSLEELS